MSALLDVKHLSKHFDGVTALEDFSLYLQGGTILGLIGPNGAGKTTFFNVVTGFLEADEGEILFRGKNVTGKPPHRIAALGISRTFQVLRLIRQVSVLENVLLSFQHQPGEMLFNVFFNGRRSRNLEEANRKSALSLLDEVGLEEKVNHPADELSYGQQKLLSIACCLASDSNLLLLDEPVAGVAPEMIDRILSTIRSLPSKGKTVILIEHNLDAVMQICDRIIFMDTGSQVCDGTPEEVRNDPRVIEAYID